MSSVRFGGRRHLSDAYCWVSESLVRGQVASSTKREGVAVDLQDLVDAPEDKEPRPSVGHLPSTF